MEMQSSAKALPDVFQDAPRCLAEGLERTACANKLVIGVMTIFVVMSSPLECEKGALTTRRIEENFKDDGLLVIIFRSS